MVKWDEAASFLKLKQAEAENKIRSEDAFPQNCLKLAAIYSDKGKFIFFIILEIKSNYKSRLQI